MWWSRAHMDAFEVVVALNLYQENYWESKNPSMKRAFRSNV